MWCQTTSIKDAIGTDGGEANESSYSHFMSGTLDSLKEIVWVYEPRGPTDTKEISACVISNKSSARGVTTPKKVLETRKIVRADCYKIHGNVAGYTVNDALHTKPFVCLP